MICIDSWGWVEWFSKGPKAMAYRKLMLDAGEEQILTSVVTLFEVYRKVRRRKGELAALEAAATLRRTKVVPIDADLALEAADYSLDLGLHFSDSLVYATARREGVTLFTGDPDFKGKPGVVQV